MHLRTPKKTLGAALALGLSTSVLSLIGGGSAQAALSETEYGFIGTAYGTKVASEVVGLTSDRTALAYIACTRLAGKTNTNKVLGVSLPSADDPLINVGVVTSRSRTWTNKKAGIAGAVEATNSISRVTLGDSSTPVLTINGLHTTSTAWADTKGLLHSKNDVVADTITLVNLPDSVPAEVQQLVDALDDGIAQVLTTIKDNGGTIEIPGLGEVGVGFERTGKYTNTAVAEAAVLRVLLYGTDTVKGGNDDSAITIGHSWARINRGIPAGVMNGRAYGATLDLLDGVVGVGELGLLPLPCRGTEGKARSTYTQAENDIVNQALDLVISSVKSTVLGKQGKSGWAYAWTAGSVTDFKLGPLEIHGIKGVANVRQDRAGRIIRRDNAGSMLGELIVDGTSYGAFTPQNAAEIPDFSIPGVAKIEFFKTNLAKRGLSTSAVVITLMDETAGTSVIRLGNAHTQIRKY